MSSSMVHPLSPNSSLSNYPNHNEIFHSPWISSNILSYLPTNQFFACRSLNKCLNQIFLDNSLHGQLWSSIIFTVNSTAQLIRLQEKRSQLCAIQIKAEISVEFLNKLIELFGKSETLTKIVLIHTAPLYFSGKQLFELLHRSHQQRPVFPSLNSIELHGFDLSLPLDSAHTNLYTQFFSNYVFRSISFNQSNNINANFVDCCLTSIVSRENNNDQEDNKANFSQLQHLELNCEEVDADCLLRLLLKLASLCLRYDSSIANKTEKNSASHAKLGKFKSLMLHNAQINVDTISCLTQLQYLESLQFINTAAGLTDENFNELFSATSTNQSKLLPRLFSLRLDSPQLTIESLQNLDYFKNQLETLQLSFVKLGSVDCGYMARLSSLRSLTLHQINGLTLRGLSFFTSLRRLSHLTVHISPQREFAFNSAAYEQANSPVFPSILSFELHWFECSLHSIELSLLQSLFPRMRSLNIISGSDRDLLSIAFNKELQRLSVENCENITYKGLQTLTMCKKLRELELTAHNSTADEIDLDSTENELILNNSGLNVAELNNSGEISLNLSNVSDSVTRKSLAAEEEKRYFQSFANFKELEVLKLNNFPMGMTGIGLNKLYTATNLQRLELIHCNALNGNYLTEFIPGIALQSIIIHCARSGEGNLDYFSSIEPSLSHVIHSKSSNPRFVVKIESI
jgi:hypothetical protein